MGSFWLWRGRDDTPESFERKLSTLSKSITQTGTRLDRRRQRARRIKVLWTLYTTFAYILYSTILLLIYGFEKWGITEYTAVFGGPFVIYIVRLGLATVYDRRISSAQTYLEHLSKQREETIEKLKVATKYNRTQQLLEKYGGSPKSRQPKKGNEQVAQAGDVPKLQVQRTGFAPPPTANIPRNSSPLPQLLPPISLPSPQTDVDVNRPGSSYSMAPSEDFAPNAFGGQMQYSIPEQSRWYDRLMDVLLGEDETLAKNRLALICKRCRLVNGQAPPGIKRLEEVGKWKCGGCGAWNGEESETEKIVKKIKKAEADTVDGFVPVSKAEESATESSNDKKESDDDPDSPTSMKSNSSIHDESKHNLRPRRSHAKE